MLQDIKVTKKELEYMMKNKDNDGTESYIYKIDDKTAYKIFRTVSPEVLENKFQKIKALHQKSIDFMVNPLATLPVMDVVLVIKCIFLKIVNGTNFLCILFILRI